ncbi:MAG TPA: hypothetical protein VK619_04075, partial [Pyrinomonadaceae bacterium]|nr:hypothetical protein [Pyrinomonadaceae bacterium]
MSGSIMTLVDQNGSQYKLVYQTKSLTDATEILTRKEAALILAEYIFKSTGWNFAADWTDDTEPQPNKAGDSFVKNIFVGDSDWVRKLGVTFSNFTPETYLIQVLNDNLILAGLDSPGDPWNLSTTYGTSNTVYARPTTPTLHAVSAFLQTYVKARWYWPGWSPADEKLLGRAEPSGFGESYDDLHSIGLKLTLPLNRTEQPTSSLRDLELPWYPMSLHNLGFSYDKNPTGNSFASMMSRRYKRWIRLNRLGGFDQIYVQHYWYSLMPKARYGEVGQTSLPPGPADFYAFYKYDPAQPAKRGGNEEILPFNNYPIDGKYQICVSGTDTTQKENPKILTEIVNYPSDGTIDKSGDTGGIAYQILHTASQPQHSISIAPNDDDGHCTCALCYEKDNVKPTGTANQFTYDTNYLSGTRNLGDRYFWFFNKVAKMVSQQSAALHSPCWVTTFAYGDYILPYSVKASVKAGSVSLEKNLIVYDTHNTYLFRNYDVNQAGATLPETVNA